MDAWPADESESTFPSIGLYGNEIRPKDVSTALKKLSILHLGNEPTQLRLKLDRMWKKGLPLLSPPSLSRTYKFVVENMEVDFDKPKGFIEAVIENFIKSAENSPGFGAEYLSNLKDIFNLKITHFFPI